MSTIGIGSGQPSRVDSCKIAVSKARKFNSKISKIPWWLLMLFFLFQMELMFKYGIKTIIQPGLRMIRI